MLDNVARVSDHSGNEHFAVWELDVLPDMVLMLVARVGGFKRVRARVYLQHNLHDVAERRIMDPRSLIDSVARVVTNLFRRDTAEAVIQRLDVHFGSLPALANAQGR